VSTELLDFPKSEMEGKHISHNF